MAVAPKVTKTPLLRGIGGAGNSPLIKVKGTRKPANSLVDTNLSSHDRTDPFSALNILLKLFSSLPSRIGGCQYKLTPEEHKLSLHLLTIVEPFVSIYPDTHGRSFTRQPTEILDAITSHVESKDDLLSLSLTCKRMHGIVFPRHYEYRWIRCKVSSISVWNHLIVHRSLANNVRKLEILDERAPKEEQMIPRGIMETDTDLESTDDELGLHDKQERYLVAALGRMGRLEVFKWACNHSPISIDNIWPTLLRCGTLKEISIFDNLVFQPFSHNEDANRKGRQNMVLPVLNTVTLRSTQHSYGSTKTPDLYRIKSMLNQCPNLQNLNITYTPPRSVASAINSVPRADEFLLSSRWSSLTKLTLINLHIPSHSPILAPFLEAHVNLEVLHIAFTNQDAGIAALATNTLPRLRELTASKQVMSSVLGCPCNPPRPLEVIKGFKLAHSRNIDSKTTDKMFLRALQSFGRTIKKVELAGWNDLEDIDLIANCLPGITWLDIGKKLNTPQGKNKTAPGPVTNLLEWVEVLEKFPELTAFHGVRFFYEVSATVPAATLVGANLSMTDRSRVRKNDEIAGKLAWKCRKLRRVDHWEENCGKIIVILRDRVQDHGEPGDRIGARWEVRRVKL